MPLSIRGLKSPLLASGGDLYSNYPAICATTNNEIVFHDRIGTDGRVSGKDPFTFTRYGVDSK
jgi:hypothetical protein